MKLHSSCCFPFVLSWLTYENVEAEYGQQIMQQLICKEFLKSIYAKNRAWHTRLLTRHCFTGIWDRNFKECYAYSKINLGIEFHQPNQDSSLWSSPFVSSRLFLQDSSFMHKTVNNIGMLGELVQSNKIPWKSKWSVQLKDFDYFLTYTITLASKKNLTSKCSVIFKRPEITGK